MISFILKKTCLILCPTISTGHTESTVKPVYKDHPWNPKIVAVVDWWSLFKGHLCSKSSKWDLKMGRYWQVVAIRMWLLAQVWLYFISFCYTIYSTSQKDKIMQCFTSHRFISITSIIIVIIFCKLWHFANFGSCKI